MASNKAWNNIFRDYKINSHDFDDGLFNCRPDKKSCQVFTATRDNEPRILYQ